MRTFEEYRERLGTLRPNIHLYGKVISRLDPILETPMNNIKLTFDKAYDPKYEHLTVTTSHLTGEKINRFCNINRSVEDLLTKQEMIRRICQLTSTCVQRCMGTDMLNAMSVFTKEIDDAKGTDYHQRFLEYLKYFQKNDLVGCGAQTDVKGDRSLRPHQQKDPDLYVHVVDKKKDGIIVRGAKIHNSVAAYADEILVVPTRTLTAEESDWAVAFAIPADAEGVHQIVTPSIPRLRKHLKAPSAEFGACHSVTVFDDTFIPWERVFMCGEWEFGGRAALLFALFHRHSYTGCKPADSDRMLGATALVADYNGIGKAKHVQHSLADLISVGELVYAAGIASAVKAVPTSSGTYTPDVVFCNVGRRHAGENVYEESRILCEVAGGLPATLPMEEDFYDELTGPLLNKYIMRREGVSSEDQNRCFRMISDLIASAHGANHQIGSVHGGGSPVMEIIALLANYDVEAKKKIAKYLAGISGEPEPEPGITLKKR